MKKNKKKTTYLYGLFDAIESPATLAFQKLNQTTKMCLVNSFIASLKIVRSTFQTITAHGKMAVHIVGVL